MKKLLVYLPFILLAYSSFAQETHIDTAKTQLIPVAHGKGLTGEYVTLMYWNRRNGKNILLRPNGTKYLVGYYKVKKDSSYIQNGLFTFYHKNGKVMQKGKYQSDKKIGEWIEYDSTGNILSQKNFSSKVINYYHQNGAVKSTGKSNNIESDSRNGKWSFFHSNGKIRCSGKLNWTGKIGLWLFWDEKGELIKEVKYKKQRFRFYRSINVKSDYSDVCDCN